MSLPPSLSKPPEIVARDREWDLLASMWATGRPELAIVLGRRRVGKSFLLSRFARSVGGLHYQATRRTEAAPHTSSRTRYRITDPYVGFWHRFVAPLVAAGSVGLVPPERLWASAVAPRLDDYMGAVFESACRHAVRAGTLPLPFPPSRVGEWWDAASQEQIDVVAVGADGDLLVGECKWGDVTGRDLATLERRAQLVGAELGGVRRVHLAVFSGRGRFDEAVAQAIAAGRVLGFGADALV